MQKGVRKVIRASKDLNDMINDFETRLDELIVTTSTKVKCSDDSGKKVEIYEEDQYDEYRDIGGGFSGDATADGEIYTMAEIKHYWNHNYNGDPSLAYYDTFDDWWRDTREFYLEKV